MSFQFNGPESEKISLILRFALMVKNDNYKSVADWQEVFEGFPNAFTHFTKYNTMLKILWYIHQYSENLLEVIETYKNELEYQKKYLIFGLDVTSSTSLSELVEHVFSEKYWPKTITQIIKQELEEKAYWED